jgi:[acyl-carrier-protein] S-malonyltransferase
MLLQVSAPFHCRLMQPAADAMAQALAGVTINKPKVPVVSNVLASAISDPDEIRKRLVEQVTGTVRWRECGVDGLAGRDAFLEIGAGKVLSGLVKRIADGATGVSVGGPGDIEAARQPSQHRVKITAGHCRQRYYRLISRGPIVATSVGLLIYSSFE